MLSARDLADALRAEFARRDIVAPSNDQYLWMSFGEAA